MKILLILNINKLHWIRDLIYHEDESQRHISNLPAIFAACFSIAITATGLLGGTHAEGRKK